MTLPSEGHLLRIFVSESDRHEGKPLYEWLVREAQARGLAGATALRGLAGFGIHGQLHKASILRLASDLPIVVEIVDSREKVEEFLSSISDVVCEGIATLEKVEIRTFGTGKEPA
jgi:PII-like signaling protein